MDVENTYALFVDYGNLFPAKKEGDFVGVIVRALVRDTLRPESVRGRCDVRIYGGWYEGSEMTHLAQQLSVEIQRDFPRVISAKTPDGAEASILINVELAVALMEDPASHLFNTYRRKGKPANVRVQDPADLGCSYNACPLSSMKKLLKTGTCPQPGCAIVQDDIVYRHEQKIVDTMLTCDLLYAGGAGYKKVLLISSDDDFLPPLRTLAMRGVSVVRLHTRVGTWRQAGDSIGQRLIEMDY